MCACTYSYQAGPEAAKAPAKLPAKGVHLKTGTSAEPLRTHIQIAPSGCCFIHHCSEAGGPQDPTPTDCCISAIDGRVHVFVCMYLFGCVCSKFTVCHI